METVINKNLLLGHPTKLKEGNWGACVHSERCKIGDIVSVKTRRGEIYASPVKKVFYWGDSKFCEGKIYKVALEKRISLQLLGE